MQKEGNTDCHPGPYALARMATHPQKRTEHPNPPASGKEEDIAGEASHRKDFPSRRGIQSAARCLTLTLVFLPFFPAGKAAKRKREGNTDKNKFIIKREIILSGAEKGYALSWSAFTRASRAITISMTDETGHQYFTLNKADEGTGHYAYKFLGEGSDTCAGNQLKVSIENSYPEELQTVVSATQIYGSDGRLKGISYTVCAEDYTDANFSDFCLNVVAWLK
ncbi:hypothetical protein [Bacteroides intestinalis]|uniref:hypothetical protein n=1 Tax=Bacteroides intestinalis TaxID=329854 RepID=UPI0022E76D4A|nr:hypothetical protein [Bacteroides intestinalis]